MSGSLTRTGSRLGNLRKVRANRQQIHAASLWNSITPPLRNRLRRHAAKPRYLCGPAKLVDQKYGLWIAHARHGNHSYRANANHSCGDPCNATLVKAAFTSKNALGNDLPFYGLCRVNDTGQLEHFSQTAR